MCLLLFLYPDGRWVCSICDLTFGYKSKLERHYESVRHKALTAMQSTDSLMPAVIRDVTMDDSSEEVKFEVS